MALFNATTLGWQWTRMTVDEHVPYFDVIYDDFPLEGSSEYEFPPGSIVMCVEACYETLGTDLNPWDVGLDGEPIGIQIDEPNYGPYEWYNDIDSGIFDPPTYQIVPNASASDDLLFYACYEDAHGNVGPLRRCIQGGLRIANFGSLRGNVFLRPFDSEGNYAYNRYAAAINIYINRPSKPGYFPILRLDFKNGWRALGSAQYYQVDVHNLDDPTYNPFRYVSTSEFPGLVSFSGTFNIATSALHNTRNVDSAIFEEHANHLKIGDSQDDREAVTLTFTRDQMKYMEEAKGNTMKTAGNYPWRMYNWPTMDFNYYHGYSLADIGSDWRWKASTIHENKAYIGGIARLKPVWSLTGEGGTVVSVQRDRILSSPFRNYDRFFRKDYLDIVNEDGDELIAIEKYADRIFVFKRNKTYILNTSKEITHVETEVTQGISSPSSICKTHMGLAFATDTGVWFHNGQNVVNISNRSFEMIGLIESILKEFGINEITGNLLNYLYPSLGYDPKTNVLILSLNVNYVDTVELQENYSDNIEEGVALDLNNDGITDSSDLAIIQQLPELSRHALVFDFESESWSKSKDIMPGYYSKTNFVDLKDNLVYYNIENGTLYKWSDKIHEGQEWGANEVRYFKYQTPFVDFGLKNVQKLIKKVYITWRMRGYGFSDSSNISNTASGIGPNVQVYYYADSNETTKRAFVVKDGGYTETAGEGGRTLLKATNDETGNNYSIHVTEFKLDGDYDKIFNFSLVFQERGTPGQSLSDEDSTAGGQVDGRFEIKDITIVYSEQVVR